MQDRWEKPQQYVKGIRDIAMPPAQHEEECPHTHRQKEAQPSRYAALQLTTVVIAAELSDDSAWLSRLIFLCLLV